MTLDKVVVDRIDNHLLKSLKSFFENGLSTTNVQMEGDRRYINVICKLKGLEPEDYLERYNACAEKYAVTFNP